MQRWWNPTLSSRRCTFPSAIPPDRMYVIQLTADLAIHAWDLARATGQDDAIDPGAVALLLPWAEAYAELLAASGMFGSPIDVGAAPDEVRLLGLVGRHA